MRDTGEIAWLSDHCSVLTPPHISTSAPWQILFNLLGSKGVSLVKTQIRVGATAQSGFPACMRPWFQSPTLWTKKKISDHTKTTFEDMPGSHHNSLLNLNTQASKNDQILRWSGGRIQPMPPLWPPRSRRDFVIDRHTTCYQCHCACYIYIYIYRA